MSKPKVLVLGGVGFIGKNFVTYLVENDLCSKIRVVDKVMTQTAHLTQKQKEAFAKVEYMQKSLVNPTAIAQAFAMEDEGNFDIAINLAAETKYSQTEDVYNERVFLLSTNCAKEAAKRGVSFVEVSTAQIYDADKKASDESDKAKPWTAVAKAKLKAEEELKNISGLNYAIIRPAIVYGTGDIQGLTPRLIIGAVYKQLGEEMKFLWTKELRINTVHVKDVSKALFLVAQKLKAGDVKKGEIFNLADSGDTCQETIAAILRDIYGIKTDYQGTMISNFAKLNLESVTEDINDMHLQPWSDLCKSKGINNSPLTPYLDKELLYNNSLSVDGTKITKLGFTYDYPKVTKELLVQVLKDFIEVKAFPEGFVSL